MLGCPPFMTEVLRAIYEVIARTIIGPVAWALPGFGVFVFPFLVCGFVAGLLLIWIRRR